MKKSTSEWKPYLSCLPVDDVIYVRGLFVSLLELPDSSSCFGGSASRTLSRMPQICWPCSVDMACWALSRHANFA